MLTWLSTYVMTNSTGIGTCNSRCKALCSICVQNDCNNWNQILKEQLTGKNINQK